MKHVYLDTNVYNALCERTSNCGQLTLRHRPEEYRILLSPINILEILQVSDKYKREGVVRLLQAICDIKLLADVEKLIVNYVVEKHLIDEHGIYALSISDNESELDKVWADIKSNPSKTFIYSHDTIGQLRILKQLESVMHVFFSRGGSFSTGIESLPSLCNITSPDIIKTFKNYISDTRQLPPQEPRPEPWNECIWFLITMILCVGLTPFPSGIDRLWKLLKQFTVEDRLAYAFDKMSFLCSNGPFIGMGALMGWQVSKPHSRGNIFDCYHVSYLPYVHEFYTLDEGLLSFARSHPQSVNFSKILDASLFIDNLIS
ncbi:MAG: hypothetical protein Q7T53_01315 [Deltaproteobacteria bacterium]|nr:hypothetical protein [Deltaproteobacteria bacterium]